MFSGLQRLPFAAACPGVRRPEGLHHGAVLLHDELCGLLHDVPSDPGTVRHQTLHHLQHVGGRVTWLSLSSGFVS